MEVEFITHTFRTEHPRSRCSDAVQNIACFTSTHLCQMHEDLFLRSSFYSFPSPREGELCPKIFDIKKGTPSLQ